MELACGSSDVMVPYPLIGPVGIRIAAASYVELVAGRRPWARHRSPCRYCSHSCVMACPGWIRILRLG